MQKVEVKLIDDLDGQEAAESVSFGIDGLAYEIDLSTPNAAKLRKAIAPFIEAARPIKRRGATVSRPSTTRAKVDKVQLDAMRQWGLDHGYEVNPRGRIPAAIQEAYHAAQEVPDAIKPRRSRPKATAAASE